MLLQRTVRVEPQPGAAFTVFRNALDGACERSLMSKIDRIDQVGYVLSPSVGVKMRCGARKYGFEILARSARRHSVKKFAVAFHDRRHI